MPITPFVDPEEMDDLRFEGGCAAPEMTVGDAPAPEFTGLLDSQGFRIYRHAVVPKVGFHPEERRYWCPTLEDEGDQSAIVGWSYAAH